MEKAGDAVRTCQLQSLPLVGSAPAQSAMRLVMAVRTRHTEGRIGGMREGAAKRPGAARAR